MNESQLQFEIAGTFLEPILLWTNEHGDRPDRSAGFDEHDVLEAMNFFAEHKLISDEFDLGGSWDLLARGRRIAEQIVESRTSGLLRAEAVEKSLLWFISDEKRTATGEIIGRDVQGIAVTEGEHADAVAAMHRAGLISGVESFGYDGLTHPEATALGRRRMHQQGVPSDPTSDGGTTINNDNRFQNKIKGDVGQVATGVNVTQTGNYATFDKRTGEAREKVSQLRELLSEIEDVPESINSAFQELEAVSARPESDQSAWKIAAGAFSMALLTKAGEESYVKVMEAVGALGQLLGAA